MLCVAIGLAGGMGVALADGPVGERTTAVPPLSTPDRPPAAASSASTSNASAVRPPPSGVYLDDLDPSVRPQDDFYRYAVGGWMARVKAPAYLPGWSASRELQLGVYEALDRDLRALAQGRAPTGNVKAEATADKAANQRKLADFHASYMDLKRIDAAGLRPVRAALAEIDRAAHPGDLVRVLAHLSAQGLDIGFGVWVHADDQAPTHYLADVVQADLGLPDRDYYLSQEGRFAGMREAYRAHVERLLALAGTPDAAARSRAVLDLETALAQAQWTQVATRVPGATTHRVSRAELSTAVPGLDLAAFVEGVGVPADSERFNLAQPDFLQTYGRLLRETPAPVWQAYLRYRLLDHLARFLPAPYRDEADRFWTLTFSGAAGVRPRWLRAMGVLETAMGDALGQLYVERHFPASARVHAQGVLDDVIAAFRQRITAADWLSDESQRGALAKLDQLVIRLGAPDHIHDYSGLRIVATDPVGNWLRARTLQARFEVDKLRRPVDREEWTMSAQQVNGYYSVSRNQVVLPAALLQPPYFQADADDAVNYGGLGFFMAHELTHAFDRAGSQYDGAGRRVEWMTAADRAEFERRTHALVSQYGALEVAPGERLNGELTIGENIADVSGLAIAHEAWLIAQRRRPAGMRDGLGPDQRFYLGFARIWAAEPVRTAADVRQALSDTHAPDRLRVIGAVMNQAPFMAAFDVREGDPMYRAPAQQVRIW